MKKIIFLFLLVFLFSCSFKQTHSKKKVYNLKSGKDFQELINSEYSDFPDFIEFSYAKENNSIYYKVYNNSELSRNFVRISLNKVMQKKDDDAFFIYGTPGQCPECILSSVTSVTVLDNMVAVGMFTRGYNFYDLEGNFLFQILSPGCPSGQCFLDENGNLISLPDFSDEIEDYAIYIFDIQSKKLKNRLFKGSEFLSKTLWKNREELRKEGSKITSFKQYISKYNYAYLGNKKIVILPSNGQGVHHYFLLDLNKKSIEKVSLLDYCKVAYPKSPRTTFFTSLTTIGDKKIVFVRPVYRLFDNKELFKKYKVLLMVFKANGELIDILVPPENIFSEKFTVPWVSSIQYVGNNTFLINQRVFYRKVGEGGKPKKLWQLIKFKAKKLSEEEKRWVLERL